MVTYMPMLWKKSRFKPNIEESNITVAIKGDVIAVLGEKVKSYTKNVRSLWVLQ